MIDRRAFIGTAAVGALMLSSRANAQRAEKLPRVALARYNGSGDINVAANFTCVTAGVEQPGVTTADLNQIRNSLRQRALLAPVR